MFNIKRNDPLSKSADQKTPMSGDQSNITTVNTSDSTSIPSASIGTDISAGNENQKISPIGDVSGQSSASNIPTVDTSPSVNSPDNTISKPTMGPSTPNANASTSDTGMDIGVQSSPSSVDSTTTSSDSSSVFGSVSDDTTVTSQKTAVPPSPFSQSDSFNTSSQENTSILDPVSKNEKEIPSIIPGTPGNSITPPENNKNTFSEDSSLTSSTGTIPSIMPTMGSPETSSSNPISSPSDSSASGQPLNISTINSEGSSADNSPLKSPPMPGVSEIDDDKKDEQNIIDSPPSPSTVISSSDTKSGGKFKFFVIILIVITILVYAVVAYLYFTGDKDNDPFSDLFGDNSATQQVAGNVNGTTTIPTKTPTPVITEMITINNGDVVKESSIGDITVLVKKNDYPETGIVGFQKVNQSPDKSKLCFYSLSPADDPAMYISDSDGTNVEKLVSDVSSCYWSSDSSKIAYTNTADATSPVDIYIYDTKTLKSTNLTAQSDAETLFRRYEIESWSENDTKINCNFQVIDTENTDVENTDLCEIDFATKEVLDL
ncbi:hypothetical protein JXA63_00770 [Candidatus Woesebacteria bacterium]|nr:hypothetical protein [Candidatus Woesebacteria bacterium]